MARRVWIVDLIHTKNICEGPMADGAIAKKSITNRVISDGAIANRGHRRWGHFRMGHPWGKNPFKKKKCKGANWPRDRFVDKYLKCFQTPTAKARYLKLQQIMNLFKEVSNQFFFKIRCLVKKLWQCQVRFYKYKDFVEELVLEGLSSTALPRLV